MASGQGKNVGTPEGADSVKGLITAASVASTQLDRRPCIWFSLEKLDRLQTEAATLAGTVISP